MSTVAERIKAAEEAERQARELALAMASAPVPTHPGANWGEAMAERDRRRVEEQKRLAAFYERQERGSRVNGRR